MEAAVFVINDSFIGKLQYIWTDDIPTAILQAPGKLDDKYCRLIKEKFSGFNREIKVSS